MDTQRMVLLGALFVIVVLLWQAWVREHPQDAFVPEARVTTEQARAPLDEDIPEAPSGAEAGPALAKTAAPRPALKVGQRVEVITDLVRAEIDVNGGDLRQLDLLQYPVAVNTPDKPLHLLTDQGQELFVARSGLIGGKERVFPNHNTVYRPEQDRYVMEDGQDQLTVRLHWTAPDGIRYTKLFTFHRNRYVIDVAYEIENTTALPWYGHLYGQFLRTHVEGKGSFYMGVRSYLGGAVYSPDEKFEKISLSDMLEKDLSKTVTNGWIAMLQHYFVGAWLPARDAAQQFYTRVTNGGRYNIGYKQVEPLKIGPGQTGRLGARLYLGPKEQKRLERTAPGLVLTVDYGWLTPISAPLFWLLQYIHGVVGNWGWAIIILTILIKLTFYPLSATSYKSMAKMKKLQPRMTSLKERHKDDKQKLQKAMMELYKSEKVNPLGGCLPIVVQIPVFIALYWVLLESVELRQADFALWLNDLSSPDPYFVLPIIMGISMVAQHLLNPSPVDPMQKKIMMALPVVFTVFFLFFPAGLVLYWVVNNILSIAQQWRINRVINVKGK